MQDAHKEMKITNAYITNSTMREIETKRKRNKRSWLIEMIEDFGPDFIRAHTHYA